MNITLQRQNVINPVTKISNFDSQKMFITGLSCASRGILSCIIKQRAIRKFGCDASQIKCEDHVYMHMCVQSMSISIKTNAGNIPSYERLYGKCTLVWVWYSFIKK